MGHDGTMEVSDEITVALVPAAAAALIAEEMSSDLDQVDVVNRALQIYHHLMEEIRQHNQLLIRDVETRRTKPVYFD
jgi:hypothetical protein